MMGFFKDLNKLQKQGKELTKDWDPAARMREASAQMQRMAQQGELMTSGVRATATINALRDTGTEVNLQPVIEVDVTVFPDGGAPFPATATTQGHAALASLSPGAQVVVRYDPADPGVAVIAV